MRQCVLPWSQWPVIGACSATAALKASLYHQTCPCILGEANEADNIAAPQLAGETALCCHGRLSGALQSSGAALQCCSIPDQWQKRCRGHERRLPTRHFLPLAAAPDQHCSMAYWQRRHKEEAREELENGRQAILTPASSVAEL
jgi:hypothetical protein